MRRVLLIAIGALLLLLVLIVVGAVCLSRTARGPRTPEQQASDEDQLGVAQGSVAPGSGAAEGEDNRRGRSRGERLWEPGSRDATMIVD